LGRKESICLSSSKENKKKKKKEGKAVIGDKGPKKRPSHRGHGGLKADSGCKKKKEKKKTTWA